MNSYTLVKNVAAVSKVISHKLNDEPTEHLLKLLPSLLQHLSVVASLSIIAAFTRGRGGDNSRLTKVQRQLIGLIEIEFNIVQNV